MQISIASKNDVKYLKELINEMYGFDYEKRTYEEILECIKNKKEIYVLAKDDEEIIGFAGARTNSEEYLDVTNVQTVIEYIYVKHGFRNLNIAFLMMKKLIEELVIQGYKSAILQVQSFNKQRFFHYALTNKNILKSTKMDGNNFYDEILLVDDLQHVLNLSVNDFFNMVKKYVAKK